jgi:regulator of nonsense transcripts 2
MEATNFEYSISKGELSDERKEKYDYAAKSFERLHSSAQTMSEALGLSLPELKEEEKTTRIGMVISAQGGEEDTEEDYGYWDDDEEKAFYEDIIDLKNLIPAVLLGEKVEEKKEELDEPEIPMEEVFEEEDSEEEEKTVSTGPQADLDNLITRLNEAMNRESIDKLAVEFCYLNSKAARGKIVKALLSVSRMRLDLLPYFSRFVAILKSYMPDVSSVLVETLLKKFWGLWKNFRPDLGYVEDRIKNIRFIGELVKFKVAPYYAAFRTLNCLIEDFTGYHIDVTCNLLDTCGKFLFRNPVTHSRFVNVVRNLC